MPHIRSFAPVADTDAEVLILGSMPGEESLRAGQYYAHPRNAFWKIMGDLVGASPELPYQQRLRMLKAHRIALWDVLESCERRSSLDSHITQASANDIASFLAKHPRITQVFFNGAKAEQCFRRHMQGSPEAELPRCHRLPSTSPAHAGMTYAEKLDAWRAILPQGGQDHETKRGR